MVNMLGRKEGEALLSKSYIDHLKDSQHSYDTHMISFDYHYHCKGGKMDNLAILTKKARPSLDNFGFFSMVEDDVLRLVSYLFTKNYDTLG